MADQLSVVGKRVYLPERHIPIVTGAAKYTGDFQLVGMLHARILQSPHPHARVVSVDASKAEALPGFRAILTHKDSPSPLDGKARYVGDAVAYVAADDDHTAERALDLIKVEYQILPATFDPWEAMKPNAPAIHEGGNIVPPGTTSKPSVILGYGDIEKGFKSADLVFEDDFRTHIQTHMPLETHSALAAWKGDELTVWDSTQQAHRVQDYLSQFFKIPTGKIRVICNFVGGGFGAKCWKPVVSPAASALARKTGRPVRLVLKREESSIIKTRHSTILHPKVGLKRDGTLTSIHTKVIFDTGAYEPEVAVTVAGVGGASTVNLYRVPNALFEAWVVYTNKPNAAAFRGFGNPQGTFAMESLMDRIAEELNMDPIELRRKNHIMVGDPVGGFAGGQSFGDPFKFNLQSCGLPECLTKGAREIGWKEKWKPYKDKRFGAEEKRRGVGMAIMFYNSGLLTANAKVTVNVDGTVEIGTAVTDMGNNSSTTLGQIAAEALGVRFEDVKVAWGDTTLPVAGPILGSRTAHVVGNAVKNACEPLRGQIFERAAKLLSARAEDLVARDGYVYSKRDPKSKLTLAKVMKALGAPISTVGTWGAPPGFRYTFAKTFAAQFAEVEVDVETGKVKVLKFVAAHDIGRAINPTIVEQQIEGSVNMGVGYALTEELLVDGESGRPLNPNFTDYKVLSFLDMVDVKPIMVETFDQTGPYGVKGVGEPALVPTAPAIGNAVYNAVGVRIKDLPLSAEKILKALKEKTQ